MEILIIILIIYFLSRKNYKRAYKKKSKNSSKVTTQNKLTYYRELPNYYSPAIVSILCNYQLEAYKDIPAVILNLCTKRYIDIKEIGGQYEFVVINNNQENLLSHEKYILNWIINRSTFDREKWKNLVENDACSLDLIQVKDINEIKKKVNKDGIKTILKPIIGIVLIISVFFGITYYGELFFSHFIEKNADKLVEESKITEEEKNILLKEIEELEKTKKEVFTVKNIIIIYIFGTIILYIFIGIPWFIISAFATHAPKSEVEYAFKYKRTDKGNEDYIKWLAFKEFLLDFSLIDTRDIKEVYLWEYYLGYATSLWIADQVIKSSDERMLNNKIFHIINYSNFIENLDRSIKQF